MALISVKLTNLSLYTHISRIYPYTVNVYKNFVQARFER